MIQDDRLKEKEQFLEYFRDLPIQKLAAGWIHRGEDTITDWKKQDPDFAGQIASVKSAWARDNSKKVRSREWLLERIMRKEFAPPTQKTKEEVKIEGVILYRPEKKTK